jgi:F-box-like
VIRIDILPDYLLLEIFGFYPSVDPSFVGKFKAVTEAWQPLVHVCRRWRNVVLRSPRHLNLRLFCTPKTPARDTLDVWPALPLIVEGNMTSSSGTDNVNAALGKSNRICKVDLWRLEDWQLGRILAAMQAPFPELTELRLWSSDVTPRVIPDSFLDGSAPRLQIFDLSGIPFPGLPKLLLSATQLVDLNLDDIPHSGYISPEAIVAPLSELSSLKSLSLQFRSHQSRPDREGLSLPPPKRSILPALNKFHFKGVTKYLEEFVSRIDTPQLYRMGITFIDHWRDNPDPPRLAQFINNFAPTLGALDEVHVRFHDSSASVALRSRTSISIPDDLQITFLCGGPNWANWQLSSIVQICHFSLHSLPMAEDLYIENRYWDSDWRKDNPRLWLQLLLPFTAVKNIRLSKEFAPVIAAALQKLVGGRIAEVLPSLHNIFVEGMELSWSFEGKIGHFVATRQLLGRPIAISAWGGS